MPQKSSPFLDVNFGWPYGESGWNGGMDDNLLKFSMFLNGNLDSIVNTLPNPPVDGKVYFLTTDNRIYYVVEGLYYSSPTPKWFVFKLKASGDYYQFTGQALVQIPNPTQIEESLQNLPSQAVQEAKDYTDQLRNDLSEASPTTGSFQIAHANGSVGEYLELNKVFVELLESNTDAQNASLIQEAFSKSLSVFIPEGEFPCGPFFPPSGARLEGTGAHSTLRMTQQPSFDVPGYPNSKQIGMIHFDSLSATDQISSISIKNLRLVGRSDTAGFSEFINLVSLNGVTMVDISNCQFEGFQGDGIFIGSGGGDIEERHNSLISITDCVFDGINNDNRNAISIVDGDGVYIRSCRFINCTRPNMPGAIDVEPMNVFEVTRNILVEGNYFENVGGTSGVVGYTANHLGVGGNFFNTPSNSIKVNNNVFKNCINAGGSFTASVGTLAASSLTPPLDFSFCFNKTFNGARVGTLNGVSGFVHAYNSYIGTDAGFFLGLNTQGANFNVLSSNNYYKLVGRSDATIGGYGIQVSTNSQISFNNETFIDCGKSNGSLGYAFYFVDGVSDNISINSCIVKSPSGKTTYSIKKLPTHTLTASSNLFSNNRIEIEGNDFKWKANEYSIYSLTTTIDALPEGYSAVVLNGAAGIPGAVKRGLLETYKYIDPIDQSYASSIYQRFTPTSADTPEIKVFYIRKPDPVQGGWGAFSKFTGV